jgi:polyhydroxyalkanoate synthesis regulator protein
MGSYIEKNVQAFIGHPGQAGRAVQALTPEMWAQFMNMQNPMMQGMMGNYVEQSKNVFEKMQEQMQKQAEQMFGAFGMKR